VANQFRALWERGKTPALNFQQNILTLAKAFSDSHIPRILPLILLETDMRLSQIAVLALVLITAPVVAQSADAPAIYGRYTCKQNVPCADNYEITAEQWADVGNACITQGFGYTKPSGFFDSTAGLDGSDCLTALPQAIPHSVGSQVTPVCCIIKTPDDVCGIHCDLVAQ
jgi:hypothetical protein